MKKKILLSMIAAVTLTAAITTAKAQKGFYAGVQGATQIGIMFNETDADKAGSDYKSKFNFAYGVSGGYNFTNHLGIGTEVMYSRIKQNYHDNTVKYTQKLNYIKVPVFATYNTDPSRRFIFTAKAGPQIGILTKANISNASDPKLNGSANDQFKKLTFGAMIGTGVRMRVADKMYVDAGIRADGSFSNTEKKHYAGYTAGRKSGHDINVGLELGMKYFF